MSESSRAENGPGATVVIPTTGDRGPLLPLSVGSVLRQSVADLEVFIIGDGLDRASAAIARSIAESDDRVVFFDQPKGARRGELERHRVITEHASGEIVTYLCDRDLYLPWHIETMLGLLDDADLGHTLRFRVGVEDELIAGSFPDTASTTSRSPGWVRIPLSFAGHRRDSYGRLPFGWRTTPQSWGTDNYMWAQMLDQPDCRFAATPRPTVLTFKRGPHPGWPTHLRLQILEQWSDRLTGDAFDPQRFEHDLMLGLLGAHVAQAAEDGSPLGGGRTRSLRLAGRRARSRLSRLKHAHR